MPHPPLMAFDLMPFLAVPLAFLGLIFAVPILAIVTYHKRKMMEIKLAGVQKSDQAMIERIEAVRRELAQLRDTATQYDVSFDTALHRIETRVTSIDLRVTAIEQKSNVRIGPSG